jgi:hypothetical protein
VHGLFQFPAAARRDPAVEAWLAALTELIGRACEDMRALLADE